MQFKQLVAAAAIALLAPVSNAASAAVADFPKHEARLIVPFPAGGPTDVLARMVAEGLNKKWGQAVVVDNKPGAGTMIGASIVAKAPPDGYTFGITITAYTINPAIRTTMPYDTLKDLTGITQLAQANMALVARPDLPFNSVAELVDYARKNPGMLTYATPGVGTGTHLAGEMFKKEAGIDILHVPYNGSGPALTDVLGGRVDLMFDILYSVQPHLNSGKLKVLALTTSKRDSSAPNIPTIAETLPGFQVYSTIGLVAPAATPAPVISKIQHDVAEFLAQPDTKKRFEALGVTPVGSSPDAWNALIRSEIQRWTKVARESKITVQ